MKQNSRIVRGKIGEEAAAEYLARQGYEILHTNWRCRIGEIDIVAQSNGTLVIIEVRTRSERSLSAYGTPLESITVKKQLKLRKLAEAYVQQLQRYGQPLRFDCISVVLGEGERIVCVEQVVDAF